MLPLFLIRQAARSSNTATLALAYVVMALGLNIVVGFAGLLDLGLRGVLRHRRVHASGWFGSGFYASSTTEGHPHPGHAKFAAQACRAST